MHVNADDPEACLAAARLAMLYRERFHGDVVIDLVGYRRYGHNEGDEPAYTQPRMYAAIAAHPTVRELYQAVLADAGTVTRDAAEEQVKAANREMTRPPGRFAQGLGDRRGRARPRVGAAASRSSAMSRPRPSRPICCDG